MHIVKFGASSLLCSIADLAVFTLLAAFAFADSPNGVFYATVAARLLSGCLNFAVNKRWVFGTRGNGVKESVGYGLQFVGKMLLSGILVSALKWIPVFVTFIKILVDTGLFFVGYWAQKRFVFRGNE